MSEIAETIAWAVVSPPNPRSGRRYIDHGSVSYTRKGAIAMHCGYVQYARPDEFWKKQRRKGWTAEKIVLIALERNSP